jgi:hypothetical protein
MRVFKRAAVAEVRRDVARNVGLPIGAAMPSATARWRIMRQTSVCVMGCSVSTGSAKGSGVAM